MPFLLAHTITVIVCVILGVSISRLLYWFIHKDCCQIALIKGERQKDNETVVILTEGEK